MQSLAMVHEGYALHLKDDSREDAPEIAASSLALAAAYWSLLDTGHAAKLFRDAARAYARLNLVYHLILATCGNERDPIVAYWENVRKRDFISKNSDQLFYDVLTAARLAVDHGDIPVSETLWKILDNGHRYAFSTFGRLGIPMGFYISVGQLVARLSSQESQRTVEPREVVEKVRPYVERVDEVVGAAMVDHYHWKRMRSRVLPVEPEVIAICGIVNMACELRFQKTLPQILVTAELSARESVPVQIASDLIHHFEYR